MLSLNRWDFPIWLIRTFLLPRVMPGSAKWDISHFYNRGGCAFLIWCSTIFRSTLTTTIKPGWFSSGKDKYGVNTGGEIGVYYADHIVSQEQLDTTLFQAVDDSDILKMSMYLIRDGKCVFRLTCVHWWLTGFSMGLFSWPKQLSLNASITFPDCAMMNAFIEGLLKQSYCRCDLTICGLTLTFDMKPLCRHKNCLQKLAACSLNGKTACFVGSFYLLLDHFVFL